MLAVAHVDHTRCGLCGDQPFIDHQTPISRLVSVLFFTYLCEALLWSKEVGGGALIEWIIKRSSTFCTVQIVNSKSTDPNNLNLSFNADQSLLTIWKFPQKITSYSSTTLLNMLQTNNPWVLIQYSLNLYSWNRIQVKNTLKWFKSTRQKDSHPIVNLQIWHWYLRTSLVLHLIYLVFTEPNWSGFTLALGLQWMHFMVALLISQAKQKLSKIKSIKEAHTWNQSSHFLK